MTVLNLPNFLTLLRLLAIPLFLILLEDGRFGEALTIFVAAGVTDALDGAIARIMHSKTTLGAYMDPAADKLLLVSAFIALAFMGQVPRWLTVVVLMRDAVLVVGYFLLFAMTQETMEIRPSVAGKASTFFQLSSVAIVLVELTHPDAVHPVARELLFYVTGTFTAAAGMQYVYRGLAWVQRQDVPPPSAA